MVQALSRGIAILRLAAAHPDGIRLCELAAAMQLKRTTVFNLAKTLIAEGLLEKDAGAAYRPGPGLEALFRRPSPDAFYRRTAELLAAFHREHPETTMFYSELGLHDINGRIFFNRGTNADAQFPTDATLNPYLTVCGLIFFALAPDEQLGGLRLRHPLQLEGNDIWRSPADFARAVNRVRKQGFAESPATPRGELKFGVPVFNRDGMLAGALTVSWYDREATTDKKGKLRQLDRLTEQLRQG